MKKFTFNNNKTTELPYPVGEHHLENLALTKYKFSTDSNHVYIDISGYYFETNALDELMSLLQAMKDKLATTK